MLGRSRTNSKKSLCDGDSTYWDTYRWLHFSINPLCDPEMPVYLSTPKQFTDINLSLTNGILTINTGVDDCRITAISILDGGESLYEVYDSLSSVSISNFANGDAICVTKPGYIPYIASYSDLEYIQDESIEGQKVIWANEVHIGSDVTTAKPIGPVSIESGSTIIHSNDVTIKNDFEVKIGAQFEIKRQ